MIQNRQKQKQPTRRAFSGLVGMPYEGNDPKPAAPAATVAEAPAPVPVVTARKVGRPPIHGERMTPKERKRKSRAGQREKLADAERRDIVAELMKIYRRGQPKIVTKDAALANRLRGEARERFRERHDELLALSAEDLRSALAIYDETPDSHGRLHNERSGEGERMYGMSELERVIAKQYGEDYAASDEAGWDAGESSGPKSREWIPRKYLAKLRERDELITDVAERFSVEITDTSYGCKLCDAVLEQGDVTAHFWKEYSKGLDLYRHWEMLNSPGVADIIPEDMRFAARRAFVSHKHLQVIWMEIRQRRADKSAATRSRKRGNCVTPRNLGDESPIASSTSMG
jgi:hypothetical protein